jgi:hypothetical protein
VVSSARYTHGSSALGNRVRSRSVPADDAVKASKEQQEAAEDPLAWAVQEWFADFVWREMVYLLLDEAR